MTHASGAAISRCEVGFSETEATVIATAISEIARNIVRFARGGEVTIELVSDDDRRA